MDTPFWFIVTKKYSIDSDKVVVLILTTAYISHYDQCDYVRHVATCDMCTTTISKSFVTLLGCTWRQTKMSCAFVHISEHLFPFFVNYVLIY